MAVTQVPIFCPRIIGTAAPYPTAPVAQNACNIPTEAEEDCSTAVSNVPASTPRKGLVNLVRSPVNSGTSAKGFTALLMVSMPDIRMANPTITTPMLLDLSLCKAVLPLDTLISTTPVIARTGEKEDGLHKRTRNELLSIPCAPRIHDVRVVPTFAPIMMPTACCSFKIPELTNPTTMTVAAEED